MLKKIVECEGEWYAEEAGVQDAMQNSIAWPEVWGITDKFRQAYMRAYRETREMMEVVYEQED